VEKVQVLECVALCVEVWNAVGEHVIVAMETWVMDNVQERDAVNVNDNAFVNVVLGVKVSVGVELAVSDNVDAGEEEKVREVVGVRVSEHVI
jgi:hypothetical protein